MPFFENLKKKSESLFGRFVKPHPHDRIDNLTKSVQNSFTNLRKDMEHISKLLYHYNDKHDSHEKQIHMLMKRMAYLETQMRRLASDRMEMRIQEQEKPLVQPAKKEEIKELIRPEEKQEITRIDQQIPVGDIFWETLTETQQRLCWKLAALQKEMPDQWVSLKYLAQELYPDKDYNLIRSTLSQFISELEELGIVKRKRKGKQAYVYSTPKNPCFSKKRAVAIQTIDQSKENKQE